MLQRGGAREPLTVEAPTMREALEQIVDELGTNAKILHAERVTRRGLDGRGAQEAVRLTALPPRDVDLRDDPMDALSELAERVGPERRAGRRPSPDELRTQAETPDEFHGVLQRELTARGLRQPTPEERDEFIQASLAGDDVSEPLEEVDFGVLGTRRQEVDLRESVPWSLDALAGLGVPTAIVETIAAARPSSPAAWTSALSAALHPYSAIAPSGRSVLVGPGAGTLAGLLDLPTASPDSAGVLDTEAALVAWTGSTDDLPPMSRSLHLVLGDLSGHGAGCISGPANVSVVDDLAIPAALQICARHHATLLYLRVGDAAVLARPTRLAKALGRLIT